MSPQGGGPPLTPHTGAVNAHAGAGSIEAIMCPAAVISPGRRVHVRHVKTEHHHTTDTNDPRPLACHESPHLTPPWFATELIPDTTASTSRSAVAPSAPRHT